MKLERDIKESIDLVKKAATSNDNRKIYLFSNENLDDVARVLKYEDKKVLTVAGSGDQYLASVYYGAKDITTFDINPLAYYMTILKIAAVKTFSYEEFILFFISNIDYEKNEMFLKLKLLNKLKSNMPEDVYYYWTKVLTQIEISGIGKLFYLGKYNTHCLTRNNMYKEEQKYYELKEKIQHIDFPKFINSSITHLSSAKHGNYDLIYLSNILDWIYWGSIFNSKISFLFENYLRNLLENQIYSMLEREGQVLTFYDILCNSSHFPTELLGEMHQISKYPFYVYTRKK